MASHCNMTQTFNIPKRGHEQKDRCVTAKEHCSEFMHLINVCYPRDYKSTGADDLRQKLGSPCTMPFPSNRALDSAHLRALSAARGTRLKVIWNSEVKMIGILKASLSLLDGKTPSYIIWEKGMDTVELVLQLDLKLAWVQHILVWSEWACLIFLL